MNPSTFLVPIPLPLTQSFLIAGKSSHLEVSSEPPLTSDTANIAEETRWDKLWTKLWHLRAEQCRTDTRSSPASAWSPPWRRCCPAQTRRSLAREEDLWGQSSARNIHWGSVEEQGSQESKVDRGAMFYTDHYGIFGCFQWLCTGGYECSLESLLILVQNTLGFPRLVQFIQTGWANWSSPHLLPWLTLGFPSKCSKDITCVPTDQNHNMHLGNWPCIQICTARILKSRHKKETQWSWG